MGTWVRPLLEAVEEEVGLHLTQTGPIFRINRPYCWVQDSRLDQKDIPLKLEEDRAEEHIAEYRVLHILGGALPDIVVNIAADSHLVEVVLMEEQTGPLAVDLAEVHTDMEYLAVLLNLRISAASLLSKKSSTLYRWNVVAWLLLISLRRGWILSSILVMIRDVLSWDVIANGNAIGLQQCNMKMY